MGRSQGSRNRKGLTSSRKKVSRSLIPLGLDYMKDGVSVLLIGDHGTGKTETVMQLAKESGLNLKIFNCATLDPYIDLIGVPVPTDKDDNSKELEMVRSSTLDNADVIFFDEINRAPQATKNAVFEIIQFQSINGEKLPNLKCCWAAMNPPDGDYDVEDIDPALIDRFDVYQFFNPKISIQYMTQHMKKETAQALQVWWEDHKKEKRGFENYISPRRLTKIGILYEKFGQRAARQALPPGGTYDSKKLITLLNASSSGQLAKEMKNQKGIKSQKAVQDVFQNKKVLKENKDQVIKQLKKDPKDVNTQTKIVDLLKTGVGAEKLFTEYGDVLNNLSESQIEALFTSFSDSKKSQIRSLSWYLTRNSIIQQRTNFDLKKRQRLYKVLKQINLAHNY
jgi:midasin (ATPase involved in ribosome maturation)